MTTPTTVNIRLQLRADTAANWTAANPILLANELGRETDTGKFKVGDGSTAWSSLAYQPWGSLITDADIAAGAEIAVSKLANGTANQVIVTDGTNVSWSDNLTLAGDLTVNGTTTTINTETLVVEDKNIELGVVDTPTDLTADGGGITLKGATDKTINWIDSTDSWTSSEHIELASGKSYRINGAEVLNATTLGSGVTSSSLTSVGTLGSVTVTGDATAGTFIPTSGTAPTNGLYLPATNSVALSTSGVQRINIEADGDINIDSGGVFYDATNNRLAIGTTTAFTRLTVGSGSGSEELAIFAGTTGESNLVFADASSGVGSYGQKIVYNHNEDRMSFVVNASERARIDSSGRLLVGTYTSVAAGSSTASTVQVSQGAGGVGASFYSIANAAGPAGILVLGHGRATPEGLLSANDAIGQIRFAGGDGTDLQTLGAQISAEVDGTPGANDMPGRLVFSSNPGAPATGPAEAMRINSAQELLIGYTSDNGAYKLQVNSQIFATSATIATSDGRYKENVATLDGCVDLVKALRPVSFDWKAQEPVTRVDEDGETVVVREAHNFPDGKQVGFIAQEVEEVLADKPWLGSVIKQNVRPAVTDADGNELAPEEEFLGIAEGNLVAVLTSALKDAIGEIESLKARVAALESA